MNVSASLRGACALLVSSLLCVGAALAAPAGMKPGVSAGQGYGVDLVPQDLGTVAIDAAKPAASKKPAMAMSAVPGPSLAKLGQQYAPDVEPNNTPATATPLPGDNLVVRGTLFPNGDIDVYAFPATAGDRIYAATMTAFSAGSSTDSVLQLIGPDGTTVIESDSDNGTFAALSSSIAGAIAPVTGTYYLQVNDFTAGSASIRPYELHVRLQRGAPTPEVEGNDTSATANPLPANGWVSGARNPATATEQDWYSLALNAGDTVFLSLDLDPERDGVTWNGRLGFALFGDAGNQIIVVDDAGAAETPATIPSEALFFTVKNAGTYYAFVDSASATTGGPTATYHLSVSVHPASNEGQNCTVYTSTNVPQAIGPGSGLTSSTITVPGNPRIADIDVSIQLNHGLMADIDAHLRSPAGNNNGLFTDIGAAATGGQAQMDITFDDEAAVPPSFTVLRGVQLKPELNYRLDWFDGEDAGGTWTLDLYDDTNNASGGTLTSWSMTICEEPPPPACPVGTTPTTVFLTDFEAGAAGFTHSGTQDEWELGLPSQPATTTPNPHAAFTTCYSGVNCWKTDLDSTYNIGSNQDLLSPAINLAGLSAPIVVNWAMKYQMESATFDHLWVDAQQVGGASPVRLFEWTGATMTDAPGSPIVNIGASAGWAMHSARADSLAGLNTELRFHIDTDTTVNFGGAAIDDVSVTGCRAAGADVSISKDDGVGSVTAGGTTDYTIVATNAGPDDVIGATVTDTLPAELSCTWTCVGTAGGTCTAAGSGDINDTVNLPAPSQVTYTASCVVSPAASGTLGNTATIVSPIADPNPGDNSATDTNTVVQQVNLSIDKTDGVTSATPGGSVTYIITASNAGPSDAIGATVADTFPAVQTCTWTCVGGGGGTCAAASGSGNINETVNLPAGGSTVHLATCAIAASATGSVSNTATVTVPAGASDPNPGNNTSTDTDTLAPRADLSITKTDGVTTATPGGSVTYTITASNAGPSNAPGATVVDTFPASQTCTWTCVGAGGGTCTAAGSGNINDSVNLPSGGSTTYTASCTISASASGTLSNTAAVVAPAGVGDNNPGNNTATDTDTLQAAADLSITKTNGVTDATPGGSVTYTITASNAGPSNAAGATVTDTFPASQTCTWTCVGAGGGTCTASGSGNIDDTVNLPSGGSTTYTASCAIDASATGLMSNTATVTAPAGVDDANTANNSATDTDTLEASADLSITKTDGVPDVTAGGSTVYTIVASNAGPSDAPASVVTDACPAQCDSVTWTCSGTGTCTASGSGDINDVVDLAVGESVTYLATCAIDSLATGPMDNTASIAAGADVTDPATGNNSATDSNAVNPEPPSITASKTVAGSFTPGTDVTYAIVLQNAGGVQADNPGDEFLDVLPPELTLVAASATSGTAVGNLGTNTVAWNGAVAAGGSVTITIVATIDAAATGTVSNQGTAFVDVDANGSNETTVPTDDPGTAAQADPTAFVVGAGEADLSISKSDGVDDVIAGETTTTYTIVASNAGPSDVDAASITDTVPAACANATWTATGSGGASGFAASGSGSIAATGVSLPVGASVTYSLACTVADDAAGTVVNTATIESAFTDPTPANNTATDTNTVLVRADLAILKTDGVASVVPGGTLTYTIVASNAGPSAATGVSVGDTFPAACTAVAFTASGSGGASGFTAAGTGAIADAALVLPVGASVTYTATCTVDENAADATVISNTATVSAPAGVDTNAANNSATDTTLVDVVDGALVGGSKSVSGTFAPGDAVTYTIVLQNTGAGDQADNPGNEFVDPLPAGLTYVSAAATSGTTAFAAGTVTWNGAIPTGGSVTITIVANIDANATGTIVNQGAVNYDTDADGSNDATAQTDDPGEAGADNPTGFEVVEGTVEPPVSLEPQVIPATGLPMLFALALLMLGLGWRRRLG